MFFENVFNNTEWHGRSDSYINDEWKNEINKWLLFIRSKNQLERYLPRLRDYRTRRDEALTEIASAYVMEVKLKYPIISWEEKTIGDKNVEFVVLDDSHKIYCEVKSPGWEGELTEDERSSGRKDLPKHMDGEGRSIGPWRKIRYAIKKAYPKFLPNCRNLLIINDDLFVNILEIPENIDIALFEESGIYDGEKGYFTSKDFKNIGGVLVLNCWITTRFEYNYKFIANDNAREPFSLRIL
jgi:hypothetical protein